MAEVFILLGLIILNGIFAMAEIAVVSSRKARLESQAAKGDKKAKDALQLANHPDIFLSTVQVGITLIGILTGIFSGAKFQAPLAAAINKIHWLSPYSNGIATTIIVIVITYVSLVIGELVPKRIGLARPESIAKAVAKPMGILSKITFPFIWLLTNSTFIIVKLFKLKVKDNQVTEEEIKAIISEGSEHGAIEEEEKEIIERVIHLGDRNITSLMTHRTDIVWFNINEDPASIKKKIEEVLHSVYPLCDGDIDNILGVVYVKDMFLQPDASLSSLLKKALIVPENNSAYQLLEKFKKTKIHYAFVVDEYGTLHGMITINDILKAIVGEMPEDEDDDYSIIERKDGTYLVDAQIQFYDFLTRFEKTEWMNEDEHDFDTLAGFILHELKHIPHTGETFNWRGFHFEIIDMDSHRIDKVLLNVSDEIKNEIEDI
ncbi:MAG: HlyC/CorC family transporter [Chitinophagaceae bacterium]|nr:HlyC/CorC family transporter [Chitinophagaceae bacterium]